MGLLTVGGLVLKNNVSESPYKSEDERDWNLQLKRRRL